MANGFEWKRNMVCVATYKVLEGDSFLDQFEDADISFDDAGDTALGKLRYALHATNNSRISDGESIDIARDFLTYLTKVYDVTFRDGGTSPGDVIRAEAAIFRDTKKTIKDLAATADKYLKFPDEA